MDGGDDGPEVHTLATPTSGPEELPHAGDPAQQDQHGRPLLPPTLEQIASVIRREEQPIRNTINT
eukprot:2244231-Pyramimonas_sp.AAC.1